MNKLMLALAAMLGSPSDQQAFPTRDEILQQALKCGLADANLHFSIDDDGVDNADVYPLSVPDDRYGQQVECLMVWASHSGAAVGFHFEPRKA